MNFKKLKKLRDTIASQPDHKINMSLYHDKLGTHHNCGTCHCIAGWAQLLHLAEKQSIEIDDMNIDYSAEVDMLVVNDDIVTRNPGIDALEYLEFIGQLTNLDELFTPSIEGFDFSAEFGNSNYISKEDIIATLDRMIEHETTKVVWVRA